jgi:hypothetical protein
MAFLFEGGKTRIFDFQKTFAPENFDDGGLIPVNSSPTLSGDFGVPVACASEHHFFLDITFY